MKNRRDTISYVPREALFILSSSWIKTLPWRVSKWRISRVLSNYIIP